MNASNKSLLDMDALLDETMDNVEDIPDFITPPAGIYEIKVNNCSLEKYKKKGETDENVRIKIVYSVAATLETDGVPVPDGSLFSETFQFSEDGKAYFKKAAKAILAVDSLDGVPFRDIFSSLLGAEFQAKLSIRTSEKDGKTYENVNIRVQQRAYGFL